MSISAGNSGGAHILVFPYPAHGHLLPMLDLTHQLALRGLTITIVVTPKNLPFLQPLLTRHPSSIKTLTLPFPTIATTTTTGSSSHSIPPGVENMMGLHFSYVGVMMRTMSELHDPLLNWFQSNNDHDEYSSRRPVAILSDLFLGWTQNLACQLNIRRIVFIPTSAYSVSLVNYLWGNLPKREDCRDRCDPISATQIPGSPVFPFYQVFAFYHLYVEDNPIWGFLRENNNGNRTSWGIVLNSFTELEDLFLNHLKKDLGHDRVWGVGPLLPMKMNESIMERGGPSSVDVEEVMSWLDSRPDRSVVYVCFGSQFVLNQQQMVALGKGLEESGAHYIWCIKDEEEVPPQDSDRVGERGLLIKGWAPQVVILRHRAVAAYLNHGGWNSVLEGLMAGVRLLLWPMGADHFMTTKLLEGGLGLAVKVCEGAETVPNSTDLALVCAESVRQGELTQSQMDRALEMRKLALEAVVEGGSSFKNLDELVARLSELNPK